jgi:hypothetical protein
MTKDFYFNTAKALDKAKADRDKPVTPVEYKFAISDAGADSNMLWPDTMHGLLPKGTGKITLHESKPAPMTKDEALKLAKECGATTYTNRHYPEATAVTFSPLAWEKFCEQALAAPVQEPVACGYDETTGNCTNNPCCYTTPPAAQRQWVGLTEQEALDCFSPNPVTHSKNVEAKLKEKNNG